MTRRLLDHDPLSRETVWFEMDDDGVIQLTHEQDVTPIIEANKMMANDADYTKDGMKADWWHYGRIPNIVIQKWLAEEGVNVFDRNHRKRVFQLLNSPEYRYLKTTTKRHA